jgi:hypothetical protein
VASGGVNPKAIVLTEGTILSQLLDDILEHFWAHRTKSIEANPIWVMWLPKACNIANRKGLPK